MNPFAPEALSLQRVGTRNEEMYDAIDDAPDTVRLTCCDKFRTLLGGKITKLAAGILVGLGLSALGLTALGVLGSGTAIVIACVLAALGCTLFIVSTVASLIEGDHSQSIVQHMCDSCCRYFLPGVLVASLPGLSAAYI